MIHPFSHTIYCGVYGTLCCNWMPWSMQNLIHLLLTYSSPLSDLNLRIWCLDCFSTKALKAKNMLKTSLLSFKKYTQVCLEKSSIKFKNYMQPKKETTGSGPHKSLCTSYKGVEACQETRLSKLYWWCFPSTHLEQTPSRKDTRGRPVTIFSLHRVWREQYFKWPNSSC